MDEWPRCDLCDQIQAELERGLRLLEAQQAHNAALRQELREKEARIVALEQRLLALSGKRR